MRLAFYTYSYTDRLDMPIVPALEEIASTGYEGIDISGTHGKSVDPGSVTRELRHLTRKTADRLGLKIEAIITHAPLADSLYTDTPLNLNGSVDLAADVGAPLVVFHMGGPKDDTSAQLDAWKRVVVFLKTAVDYAESKGVKLAVDGVWKDWLVERPDSFIELHDEIGSRSFGVNFDPCYLMLLGHDPAEVARLWKDRILHAHLKDHIGNIPDWEHRIPGQGVVDYSSVVEALDKIGFEEAISIETFTDMAFTEACEGGYEALAPLVRS